jgi:hypothetical protein
MKRLCMWLPLPFVLAGVPVLRAAPPPPSDDLIYVVDTDRWVSLVHGSTYSIGKLDRTGRFIPDPRWLDLKLNAGASAIPPHTFLNRHPGPAYEFRSERLILGTIAENGEFIPEIGSKVIALKDYRPGPNSVPIYNLPGAFVKKDKQDEKVEKAKP